MTKEAKKQKCQQILNTYQPGQKISNEDYFFLMSIFEDHPQWEAKMGEGVTDITIEKAIYNSMCFVIHRPDGTKTDISYTKCLNVPTHASELKKACRHAIMGEILKFRDENVIFGKSVCPITGDILTKENTHIDHYDLTFAEIYSKWIECQNVKYLISKLNPTIDNNNETFFTDEGISRSFRIFHNQNTNLRAVTKYANTVILRKEAC